MLDVYENKNHDLYMKNVKSFDSTIVGKIYDSMSYSHNINYKVQAYLNLCQDKNCDINFNEWYYV
jgi:hypothetical protein